MTFAATSKSASARLKGEVLLLLLLVLLPFPTTADVGRVGDDDDDDDDGDAGMSTCVTVTSPPRFAEKTGAWIIAGAVVVAERAAVVSHCAIKWDTNAKARDTNFTLE